jgi:hypothetical protein
MMAITGAGISRKLTAVNDKLEGWWFIKRIQWISEGATDNDNLILKDFKSDIVMESVADTTTYSDTVYTDQWVKDLTVYQMDSGYIIVTVC